MSPKRIIRNAQIGTLIDVVQPEHSISCEGDNNYNNKYIKNQAFTKIGNILDCTPQSVENKWDELKGEWMIKAAEQVKNPNVPITWEFFQQLSFLSDQSSSPSSLQLNTSGNMDGLVQASTSNTNMTRRSAPPKIVTSEPQSISCEDFFKSLLPTMDKMTTDEKLDCRIEMTKLLFSFISETQIMDKDDVILMGCFIPARAPTQFGYTIKPEPSQDEENYISI